jgi:hypothetical protein
MSTACSLHSKAVDCKLVHPISPPNFLLFYWVQGYVSAANIFLLNEYNNFVDMNGVDADAIVKLVATFCRANPDKKPISAIDKFIRDANKVEVKEQDVFNPWEQ